MRISERRTRLCSPQTRSRFSSWPPSSFEQRLAALLKLRMALRTSRTCAGASWRELEFVKDSWWTERCDSGPGRRNVQKSSSDIKRVCGKVWGCAPQEAVPLRCSFPAKELGKKGLLITCRYMRFLHPRRFSYWRPRGMCCSVMTLVSKISREGNLPEKAPTQTKPVCTNSLRKFFLAVSAYFTGERATVCTNCSEILLRTPCFYLGGLVFPFMKDREEPEQKRPMPKRVSKAKE